MDYQHIAVSTSITSEKTVDQLSPLQRLPLELVTGILCWLEPADTEIVRRLSRGWKDTADRFYTKRTILQHFPQSPCPPLALDSEYNLHFRRLGMSLLLYRLLLITRCLRSLSAPP